jgi:hypothetical protein
MGRTSETQAHNGSSVVKQNRTMKARELGNQLKRLTRKDEP